MALFFAVTLFVSAFLLFLVQPMVGKMVLPLLGGAPAAWATCMVFFQALLLAGYAYAHAAIRRFGARRQAVVHLAVLAVPLVALGVMAAATGAPIKAVKALAPQGQEQPFFGAVLILAVAVGVPFFVVSTSAPLLQRWFADTAHPAARDPYFLYAASNLGSLLALVAYPFLVEPRLPLAGQAWLWSGGYLLLVGLTAACAWQLRRSPPATGDVPAGPPAVGEPGTLAVPTRPAPTWLDRLHWCALALVPSSLMLSVTRHVTTDIAPIPGLWVMPLGVYLFTFIIAFARTPRWVRAAVETVTPVAVLLLLFTVLSDIRPEAWGAILVMHLAAFFLIALNLHMELARRRPAADRLTEFFLWVSLGGVLGGLVNSLIAPLVFPDLTEYPLGLIAACFLQPPGAAPARGPRAIVLDVAAPLAVAGLAFVLYELPLDWLPVAVNLPLPSSIGPRAIFGRTLWKFLAYGVPAVVSYFWVERPLRFGLCVLAMWLVPTVRSDQEMRHDGSIVRRDRSFFGVLAVEGGQERARDDGEPVRATDGKPRWYHRLVHGTTLHGLQQWDPPSTEPLTYYHRTGPIGQVFAANLPGPARGRFAFVGLGTGTLSSYGQPGQQITFYEIDPLVKRIAEDPQYFTYLRDCKAKYDVVMGDARLRLEDHARPGEYGLIVVDAFSSDAIPIHLLTREAVQLYLSKLADDGVIALHVSNRYLKLDRVAARLAQDLNLAGLAEWDTNDLFTSDADGGKDTGDNRIPGKRSSQWVALARDQKHLQKLMELPETMDCEGRPVKLRRWDRDTNAWEYPWQPLPDADGAPLWTDDFSNLMEILNWDQILPGRGKGD